MTDLSFQRQAALLLGKPLVYSDESKQDFSPVALAHRTNVLLASLMSLKDDLSRRLRASIRRIRSEFRLLISSPTSSSSADFSRTRGRRGTLTGPVSHHFPQAKPSTTLLTLTLNPYHRVGESRRRTGSQRFTHLAQVGVKSVRPNHDSSRSIVSWPLHRPASRPNPGCVSFRFEIRFLYAHGSAQVGFPPFYILTERDTISAHALTPCSPVGTA
jgi:hypothetical protein